MNYKYLLFAGEYCYPSRGMEDFISGYSSIEEAQVVAQTGYKYDDNSSTWTFDWWHIVDVATFEIVAKGENK